MNGFALGLSLSLAFILGCVSAPLLIPRLSAQNPPDVTRWEYICDTASTMGRLQTYLNESGAEGWELASHVQNRVCLKRPLR